MESKEETAPTPVECGTRTVEHRYTIEHLVASMLLVAVVFMLYMVEIPLGVEIRDQERWYSRYPDWFSTPYFGEEPATTIWDYRMHFSGFYKRQFEKHFVLYYERSMYIPSQTLVLLFNASPRSPEFPLLDVAWWLSWVRVPSLCDGKPCIPPLYTRELYRQPLIEIRGWEMFAALWLGTFVLGYLTWKVYQTVYWFFMGDMIVPPERTCGEYADDHNLNRDLFGRAVIALSGRKRDPSVITSVKDALISLARSKNLGKDECERTHAIEEVVSHAFVFNDIVDARRTMWSGRTSYLSIWGAHRFAQGYLSWGRSLPAS
jgi:hypothetical protein